MGEWLRIAVWSFTSALRSRRDLALENVALRQQLVVVQRQPTENRSVGPEADPPHVEFDHTSRTHRSLEDDCPDSRPVEPPEIGDVVAYPQIGGLHHRYGRRLAA